MLNDKELSGAFPKIVPQIKVLKMKDITLEDALKIYSMGQLIAFESGKVTIKEALKNDICDDNLIMSGLLETNDLHSEL